MLGGLLPTHLSRIRANRGRSFQHERSACLMHEAIGAVTQVCKGSEPRWCLDGSIDILASLPAIWNHSSSQKAVDRVSIH